jgi:acyl carrier protein
MKTITEILSEIRPEFDFNTSEDFVSDGMLDSFDITMLVSALDKAYSVSIDGMDIIPENFKSIRTIKELLLKNGVSM